MKIFSSELRKSWKLLFTLIAYRMNAIPNPQKTENYIVLISFPKLRKIAISVERDLVHPYLPRLVRKSFLTSIVELSSAKRINSDPKVK